MINQPTAEIIYSVGELTERIRQLFEEHFTELWVRGEISNFKHHSSGHMYFSLKDASAQLKAVMFRGDNQYLEFQPRDGMAVLAWGRLSIYPPRGDYQLVVRRLQPLGEGELYLAFQALKEKLAREGLFDPALKRSLPLFPRRIGIVTSLTGAAIRDLLNILKRRYPPAQVIIYNARVQGVEAAAEIVAGIETFNRLQLVDVLIVGRGGGSLEDLWPFNEEIVARAIRASRIPVVSAVGHETDFTISDFVADLRAPTPSAAAELVVPDQKELLARLDELQQRLPELMKQLLKRRREKLEFLVHHRALRRPEELLQGAMQQLDYLTERLERQMQHIVERYRERLNSLKYGPGI